MKKISLPILLLSNIVLLSACEEANQIQQAAQQVAQTANQINNTVQHVNEQVQKGPEYLEAANLVYIVADIANLQNQANQYLNAIQETKYLLETAVDQQNAQQLALGIQQIDQQLNELNQVLDALNLKSQEVDEIRHNMIAANQIILASALLKEEVNIQNIDFSALDKQMQNVENEMLKLASMLILSEKSNA